MVAYPHETTSMLLPDWHTYSHSILSLSLLNWNLDHTHASIFLLVTETCHPNYQPLVWVLLNADDRGQTHDTSVIKESVTPLVKKEALLELYSMLYGSLDGSRSWGRKDICTSMAKSLFCPPETITTLLIGYTLIQNKKTFVFLKEEALLRFTVGCNVRRPAKGHILFSENSLPTSVVQFGHSVMSDCLQPHGLQHARLPCPSPTPRAYSNSCPSSWWCHPTISSSVVPFFPCLQSFLASGSLPMIQFFTSGGQSTGASASASVLPGNIQDWFPLGLTDLISLQSKELSRVLSNTTVQKHQFFCTQLSL